ncbi:MAG: hypothetical protein HZRFUVUK_001216 [Candidatus Fervidibacterota bacterium]|jgi:predicted MFS family arabinose efflux permease
MRNSGWNADSACIIKFAGAVIALGISYGIYGTTINNFLSDEFKMNAIQRGQLELPREFPGFLCALMSGALFFLSEPKAAAVASLLISIGMVGLTLTGANYTKLIIALLFWSAGTHLTQPLVSSIAMQIAKPHSRGSFLGKLRALDAIATVIGGGVVWLAIERLHYDGLFVFSAVASVLAALLFSSMPDLTAMNAPRRKFAFDRRYMLFYLLNILFGARKQLFLTFGPWVLVKVFNQQASAFARLWIIGAPLTAIVNPHVGRLVDRWGERNVLMLDAVMLIIVCMVYGFASHVPVFGLHLAFACYILDQLLFVTGIARATYLRKIAKDESDVAPSLSLGVSLDHAVAMLLPSLAGYIWYRYGHEFVFIMAAILSFLNLIAAASIRYNHKN